MPKSAKKNEVVENSEESLESTQEETSQSETVNESSKKTLGKPSIDGPGVKCDACEPGSRAYVQLQRYSEQPKIRTRIPRGPGEKKGAFETVIVNDLRINILKGETVELPEMVAQIIEDAYYDTEKALNETRVASPFSGRETPLRVDMQNSDDAKSALNS